MDFALEAYLTQTKRLVQDEMRRLIPHDSPHASELYERMLDYPLREAKGLRPSLAIATCRALGGKLQPVLPTAAVLELFHNAFLIHDDIEDGSEQRRGQPTLHRIYGMPVAVNVGDAMFALTLRPLLDNMRTLGMGPALKILLEVAEMARISTEGQALELEWMRRREWDITDEDYVAMVSMKTARYTFVTPMMLGAIVAGRPALNLEALQDFALDVGIAFQIQDDILNITGDEAAYGKEICGDLWEGKRTLMLLHALRHASRDERSRALEILAKPRPREDSVSVAVGEVSRLLAVLEQEGEVSGRARQALDRALASTAAGQDAKMPDDIVFLRELIFATGAVEHARQVAQVHYERSQTTLERMRAWLDLDSEHGRALLAMVYYAIKRAK